MRSQILALALLTCSALSSYAQEDSSKPAAGIDATNMSKSESLVGSSVATKSEVDALWSDLQTNFSSNNCSAVIDEADQFAERANMLANILRKGLAPFYGGDFDARKKFRVTQELVDMEALFNDYIRQRNEAWVMRGECFVQTNQPQEAAVMFIHALDHIDISDSDLWGRARNGLWTLVGAR